MVSRNRKIIWVCPRNTVGESVYDTIIGELKSFGFDNISVELFLTNQVEKSTHNSTGFESDIIVTNVDNYLVPTFDSRYNNTCPFSYKADPTTQTTGKQELRYGIFDSS